MSVVNFILNAVAVLILVAGMVGFALLMGLMAIVMRVTVIEIVGLIAVSAFVLWRMTKMFRCL